MTEPPEKCGIFQRMQWIQWELEHLLGDTAYDVFRKMDSMTRHERIDFTASLFALKQYMGAMLEEAKLSGQAHILWKEQDGRMSSEDIDRILGELKAEFHRIAGAGDHKA